MRHKVRHSGFSLLAAAALVFALAGPARGEEGGSGHYMPGAAASFADALLGRPGFAAANFFTFYDGSASRPLPVAGLLTATLEARVYADTVVLIYETPARILGGYYAVCAAVPFVRVDVKGTLTGPLPGPGLSKADSASGIGDLTLYPLMIGWNKGDLKYDVRMGIYAPTAPFQVGALANTGKNFWTFEPAVSVSYLSSKIGLEATAFVGFGVNTTNNATDYKSGEVFHLDGTIAQHLPLLGGFAGLGANGFFYQQVSGDSGSGATLGEFKGRTAGVGPALSYVRKIGKADFVAELKWLKELDVKNRLKGEYAWLKLAMAF
ncbi:MAG: SphA family protein [Thermoanaerobaculia bacterium]